MLALCGAVKKGRMMGERLIKRIMRGVLPQDLERYVTRRRRLLLVSGVCFFKVFEAARQEKASGPCMGSIGQVTQVQA